MPVYRAAPASERPAVTLDQFVAVFHRASGITHLLTEPAPQILAALETDATRDALMTRLAADYAIEGDARAALAARLDELVASGLVAAA